MRSETKLWKHTFWLPCLLPSFMFSVLLWRTMSNYPLVAYRKTDPQDFAYPQIPDQIPQQSFLLERIPDSINSHCVGPTTLRGTTDVPGHCFSTWILNSPQSIEMVMVLQTLPYICTGKPAIWMNVYFIRDILFEKKAKGLNSGWFLSMYT